MRRGSDHIISEYLEANATVPAQAVFNVTSWQEVSKGILEALEAEKHRERLDT